MLIFLVPRSRTNGSHGRLEDIRRSQREINVRWCERIGDWRWMSAGRGVVEPCKPAAQR